MMNKAERTIEQFASIDEMHKAFVRDIEADIADYKSGDKVENFIHRLTEIYEYGCARGAVPSLTHYEDTTRYFNKFYDNIYNYFDDYAFADDMLDTVASATSKVDVLMCTQEAKNYIVWCVYDFMAGDLLEELS